MSRVGPGLITGAADDDPSGIATLFTGRSSVRLQHASDDAAGLPTHGRNPVHVCANRPSDGKRSRRQYQVGPPGARDLRRRGSIASCNVLNIAADVAAMGEAAELVTGFKSARNDNCLRHRNCAAPGFRSVSSLCVFPQMADPVFARFLIWVNCRRRTQPTRYVP